MPDACEWAEDDEAWATGCGHYFALNDGTPTENRLAFCCYCGRPIREVATDTKDQTDA